jgi:hypothetical protein
LEEDIEPEPVAVQAAPKEETFNIENIVNKIEPKAIVKEKTKKVNPLPKQTKQTKKNKPSINFDIIQD